MDQRYCFFKSQQTLEKTMAQTLYSLWSYTLDMGIPRQT